MIQLNVGIDSKTANDAALEALRLRLRRELTAFVFRIADEVGVERGFAFDHRDLIIDGDIKLESKS